MQVANVGRSRGRVVAVRVVAGALVSFATLGSLELLARVAERVPAVQQTLAPARRKDVLDEQTTRLNALVADTLADRLVRLDPELGWRYGAGSVGDTITVDAAGQRGNGPRIKSPRSPSRTIGVWGDSFVFCSEVRDEDCWVARWQELDSTIQIRNFGVGGYGVDQALLRFQREADSFPVQVAVMGFTEDDLRRLVSVYRRFVDRREFPLFKPRFRLDGDSLELEPSPAARPGFIDDVVRDPTLIKQLGGRDLHYDPLLYAVPWSDYSALWRVAGSLAHRVTLRYLAEGRIWDRAGVVRARSEAFRLQVALFDRFVRRAREKGITPVIVILPGRGVVEAVAEGRASPLAPLLDTLRQRRLPFLDATTALLAGGEPAPVAAQYATGGHYSPAGNRRVAEWIAAALTNLIQ